MPTTVHVPAWKRVGLVLKASQVEAVSRDAIHVEPVQKKRKLSKGLSKLHAEHGRGDLGKASIHEISGDKSTSANNDSHTPAAVPSQLNQPSTKRNQSSSEIDNERWNSRRHPRVNQNISVLSNSAAHTQSAGDGGVSSKATLKEASRQRKKSQTKTGTGTGSSKTTASPSVQLSLDQDPPRKVPPYLSYLDRYYRSRAAWKFNKAHQSHLLKSVFNLDQIPSSYDQPLFAYIAGLQGGAARARLKEAAEAILSNRDPQPPNEVFASSPVLKVDMENPASQQLAAKTAIRNDMRKVRRAFDDREAKLEELSPRHQFRLQKRARAEKVILALAETAIASDMLESQDGTDKNSSCLNHGNPQKALRSSRGRKRRTMTGVPDDDDSSSSSSEASSLVSSTDDDSEDDSENPAEDQENALQTERHEGSPEAESVMSESGSSGSSGVYDTALEESGNNEDGRKD